MRLLKDNRGEAQIDSVFFLFAFFLSLAFGLSIFVSTAGKSNAYNLAQLAARQISANGAVDGSTISALLKVAQDGRYTLTVNAPDDGVSMQVPISSSQTLMSSTAIQYGTSFNVTVSQNSNDKIGVDAQHSNIVNESATVPGVSECWTK